MMNKKASELTLNAIIIAALALIILVVLVFIFKDQMSNTSKQYDSASDKTNECLNDPTSSACDLFKGTPTAPKQSSHTRFKIISGFSQLSWLK